MKAFRKPIWEKAANERNRAGRRPLMERRIALRWFTKKRQVQGAWFTITTTAANGRQTVAPLGGTEGRSPPILVPKPAACTSVSAALRSKAQTVEKP